MQRTVITEMIDGHQVIKGFDRPCIDPVETRKATEIAMETDPLMDQKEDLITQKEALFSQMAPLMEQLIEFYRKGELNPPTPAAEQIQEDLSALDQQIGDLAVQINALIAQIEARYKVVKAENLVYFDPKPGEEIIAEEEFNTLKAAKEALGDNQAICRDQTVIPDFRGLKYWVKEIDDWNYGVISKIGIEPPGNYKKISDLTEQDKTEIAEQLEEERILNMTAEAREAEKENKLTMLLLHANAKKEFECEAEDQPCIDAVQNWYNTEKAAIEAKYTV